jgi:hypothetical protein
MKKHCKRVGLAWSALVETGTGIRTLHTSHSEDFTQILIFGDSTLQRWIKIDRKRTRDIAKDDI